MNDTTSLASQVFRLLDQNPYWTAKPLCEELEIPYEKYGNYVNGIKQRWKRMLRKSGGQMVDCGEHLSRGVCWVPVGLEPVGPWRRTGFRGKMAVFSRRGFGTLKWYWTTGRVRFTVVKPWKVARVLQLVCCGFSWTGLITDTRVLDQVLAGVRFLGAHRVFDVGRRLPLVVIDRFRRSNGVVIRLGDRSHPTAVEVEYEYPVWAERNERLLESLLGVLQGQRERKPDRGLGRV